MKKTYQFPKNFFFGAATAAHQVEGFLENNWTDWEKKNAKKHAKNAKQALIDQTNVFGSYTDEIWERFKEEASDPSNYISGNAAEHYKRYEEDFEYLEEMNLNMYRFGIEWARIEPKEGEFDEKAINHYRKMILSLKRKNIEPMLTLWHFTLPKWFHEKGGFEKEKNVKYFSRYVERISKEFAPLVKYWITMNEPNTWLVVSYFSGDWVPNKNAGLGIFKIQKNLLKSHKEAFKIIKENTSESQVSIAQHIIIFKTPKYSLYRPISKLVDYLFNYRFLNQIKDYTDFIGLNPYHRITIDTNKVYRFLKMMLLKSKKKKMPPSKIPEDVMATSDLGWNLYPKGLYEISKEYFERYKKPIIFTEHGLADSKDKYRKQYIEESLEWLAKAMSEGVVVHGYIHWTLLDNFEWDKGFYPRFGLVEVDFKTQKRTLRESAKYYGEIVKKREVETQ